MSEVKRYTFDEICESQDFNHEEEFILASDYEHLKTKLELINKELGLNIKSHLNDICTLEKLKAQLERAEAVISFYGDENSWYLQKDPVTGSEIRRSIDFFDTESFGFQDTPESRNILKVFGGKRAREYFKEKEQV